MSIGKRAKEISDKLYKDITSEKGKKISKNVLIGLITTALATAGTAGAYYLTKRGKPINDPSEEFDLTTVKYSRDPLNPSNPHTKKVIDKYVELTGNPEIVRDAFNSIRDRFNQGDISIKTSKHKPLKGKGFTFTDFKRKFKDASDKVYGALNTDEAKKIGLGALTAIILAVMGYGGYKAVNSTAKLSQDLFNVHGEEIMATHKKNLEKAHEKKLADVMDAFRSAQTPPPMAPQKNWLEEIEFELDNPKKTMGDPYKNAKYEIDTRRIVNGVPRTPIILPTRYESEEEESYESPEEEEFHESSTGHQEEGTFAGRLKKQAGGSFSSKLSDIKNHIRKIINSKGAKNLGKEALTALIIAGLSGIGYKVGSQMIDNKEKIITKKYLNLLRHEWEDIKTDKENMPTYFAAGLTSKANKGLKESAKKITELIMFAKSKGMDKVALFSLITALLSLGGFGVFKAIKAKAWADEMGVDITDEMKDKILDYMGMPYKERINLQKQGEISKNPFELYNEPFSGTGLRAGDLSKFGEHAKKLEEEKKNAKPIAKRITDWLYSDEAKLVGKSALQYTILTALGLLTAYTGRKIGEYSKRQMDSLFNPSSQEILESQSSTTVDVDDIIARVKNNENVTDEEFDTALNSDKWYEMIKANWPKWSNKRGEAILDKIIFSEFNAKDPKEEESGIHMRSPTKKGKSYLENFISGITGAKSPLNLEKIAKEAMSEIKTEQEESKKVQGLKAIVNKHRESAGTGLKENIEQAGTVSAKKISEAGNAIYKVITSDTVKGMTAGVTVGLIVSALSILMKDKYDERKNTKNKRDAQTEIDFPSEDIDIGVGPFE